ncbi:uncharacterized protein LOC5499655 [Nematostella vectensis]|uniref:uncharacterized protein LOC5499655 n=1 Tax=Nematostella vectensis TaxID=45351 RepID=UPI00207752D7|nr:uncharacterized protein LOC5499655 [Nematostella vectensis]
MNDQENAATPRSFHLFNCDNTYDLDSVEKLIKTVAGDVQVHQTYFPLPRMTLLSQELEGNTMDCAVFVVNAHESRLSINEPRAGIGYAKIYRALLNATENQVLIVIGGDDNYKTQEERDTSVLSQWARGKVSSQFLEEYMNGSRSFIFSWDEHHHPIHEEALQHFLDPSKTDEFVPKPRPPQVSVPDPIPEPEVVDSEIKDIKFTPDPDPAELLFQPTPHMPTQTATEPIRNLQPTFVPKLVNFEGFKDVEMKSENAPNLQVLSFCHNKEAAENLYQFLEKVYQQLAVNDRPLQPPTLDDYSQVPSFLEKNKPDYVVVVLETNEVLKSLDGKEEEVEETRALLDKLAECVQYHIGKKAIILMCDDDCLDDDSVISPRVEQMLNRHRGLIPQLENKLLVMSYNKRPSKLHEYYVTETLCGHEIQLELDLGHATRQSREDDKRSGRLQGIGAESENAPNLQVLSFCHNKEAAENLYQFLEKVYQQLAVNDRPPQPPTLDDYSQVPSFLEENKPDYVVVVLETNEVLKSLDGKEEEVEEAKAILGMLAECVRDHIGKKAIILMCDDDCLDDDSVISPRVEQMLNRHRGLIPQLENKLLVMSYNKRPSTLHEYYVTETLCGHEIQLELDRGHATRQFREKDERSGRLQGIGAGQGGAARHEPGVHGSDGFYEGGRQHYDGQHGKDEEDRRGQAFGGRQGEKGLGKNKPDEADEMKMCYQAILLNGHVGQVIYRSSDFTFPDHVKEEYRENYSRVRKATLEAYKDANGLVKYIVPHYNESNGHFLHYRSTMEYGSINPASYCYPPGYKPPQYMLDDMIIRNDHHFSATLEIWEDERGQLYPTVEVGSSPTCGRKKCVIV